MLNLLFSLFEYQIATDFNFRVGTRNSWFGPATKFAGSSGYIRKVDNKEQLDSLLSKKRSEPEVIFIPDFMLCEETTNAITTKYEPKKFLVAVFVYTTDEKSVHSTESKFPNKEYSAYTDNFEWNKYGNGEQYSKYDFVIFYPIKRISDQILEYIKEDGESAGIYVKSRMNMRDNAEKCLKDGTCDVMGGTSVIGTFGKTLTGPGVWAIASMDTFGIVPYAQVGADYSISGYIATLAALQSLKDLDWKNAKRPLRFAFFDGEEIGYLGSERFLYELDNFECNSMYNGESGSYCKEPLRVNLDFQNMSTQEIETVIEVKNVGLKEDETKVFAHSMRNDESVNLINDIKTKVTAPLTIEEASSDTPGIPPSSMNSFVKINKTIGHIVFTGHKREFINKNIGTPKDNEYDPEYIAKVATVEARTLASLCFDSPDVSTIEANETFVDSLMKGFVGAYNDSKVLKELFNATSLSTDHVSMYSGVYNGYSYGAKQLTIFRVLQDIISSNTTDINCSSDSDCTSYFDSDGHCSRDKKCEKSIIRGYPAYSLAFEYSLDDKEFYIKRHNSSYPVMTETRWSNVDVRYVNLPSQWIGRVSIGVGIVLWLLLAMGGAAFWNHNLKVLKK